jgi:hypothetical protein
MDNITLDSGQVDDLELLILTIEDNQKPSAHTVRISRHLISIVGRWVLLALYCSRELIQRYCWECCYLHCSSGAEFN